MGFRRGFVARNKFEPDAPTVSTIVPGNGTITLSWAAPYGQGYSITGYQVELSVNNSVWSVPSNVVYSGTSAIVSSLVIGTSYYFRVRAIVGGSIVGKWGYYATPVVYGTVPSTPNTPTAVAHNGYVSVDWDGNTASNGYAITDYVVQYSSDSGSNWTTFGDGTSTNTYADIQSSLAYGSNYVFRIAAVNQLGQGPYSAASNSVLHAASPSAPGNVSASAGDRSFTLSWTAPANNGSAITEYIMYYTSTSDNQQRSVTVASNATSATVSARNGYSVSAFVRAVNAVDSSDSESKSATPAFPSQPAPSISLGTPSQAAPNVRTLTVSWDPVNCSAFSSAELVDASSGVVVQTVFNNGAQTYSKNDGAPNVTYRYYVRTYNSDGDSVSSSTTSATTQAPIPYTVTTITTDQTATSIIRTARGATGAWVTSLTFGADDRITAIRVHTASCDWSGLGGTLQYGNTQVQSAIRYLEYRVNRTGLAAQRFDCRTTQLGYQTTGGLSNSSQFLNQSFGIGGAQFVTSDVQFQSFGSFSGGPEEDIRHYVVVTYDVRSTSTQYY